MSKRTRNSSFTSWHFKGHIPFNGLHYPFITIFKDMLIIMPWKGYEL